MKTVYVVRQAAHRTRFAALERGVKRGRTRKGCKVVRIRGEKKKRELEERYKEERMEEEANGGNEIET